MKKTYRFLGVAAALIMAANANAGGLKQANSDAELPGIEIGIQSHLRITTGTFAILRQIIAEKFDKPTDFIIMDARFREDLGADSLDMFELVMECEKEFSIEISVSAVETFLTVEDLYKYIVNRID